jgi:Ser/Thr protein kinase RdoA (MazF antagonist)
LEEHQLMHDLEETEIPICGLRHFPDGETLKETEGIYYCLYDRFGGRAPEKLSDEYAERLGRLVARMHNVGASRQAEHRLKMTVEAYVRDDLYWLEDEQCIPVALRGRYFAVAHALADQAEVLLEGVPFHRIHGDFHLGNLLLRDEMFHVLDFDDAMSGPAVQDLWLVLPGRDQETIRQRELFLEGYETFRDFDRSTLRLIEPLRGMRLIHYSTWLARRWHDPIFPKTWPHFGDEKYWIEATCDLEDLLDYIRRQDQHGTLTPPPAEEELTNKDFFWDWEEP